MVAQNMMRNSKGKQAFFLRTNNIFDTSANLNKLYICFIPKVRHLFQATIYICTIKIMKMKSNPTQMNLIPMQTLY